MRLRLHLFGAAYIEAMSRRQSQILRHGTARLLGFLFVHRHTWQSRAVVAEALWPESDPTQSLKRLSTSLWRSKKELSTIGGDFHDIVRDQGDCLGFFDSGMCWIDTVAFERRLKTICETKTGLETGGNILFRLERTLSYYTDDLLSDLDCYWLYDTREAYRSLFVEGLLLASAMAQSHGQLQKALTWAKQGVVAEPLREDFHRQIMEIHLGAGNRALAIKQYEKCRCLLDSELSVLPTPETTSLYKKLLSDRPVAEIKESLELAALSKLSSLVNR